MNESSQSAERLRELLLDLEQSQERERALRAQSEALLAGVKALTEASTPDDLFARVIEALREPLSFDDAFVLRSSLDPSTLVATAATSPMLLGSRWTIGKGFARILHAGRVVVHLDTALVGEWKAQPDEVRAAVGSAICIPLRGAAETALLVCTRRNAKGFQPAQERMAQRFQPLVTQALREAERVAQVECANRDMRLVLDSVDQGLLTIDRDARIVGETSGAVRTWFGAIEPGTSLTSVIARICPRDAEAFEMGWQQIIDDILPLEVALDGIPTRVRMDRRTLALQLRPIGDGHTWTRMLVVVSDVTAVLEHERAEERRGELAAVVTRIVRDRAGFQSFWDEATSMVGELVSGRADNARQLRLLHTLKGNAASMGLGSISRRCHELEECAGDDVLPQDRYTELAERWEAIATDTSPILGEPPPPIAITEEEHRWLMRELDRTGAPSHLSTKVGSWAEERVEVPIRRLADQARYLAERLDKPDLDVRIEHRGLRVDPASYRPFFSALVHAIRNAVDHGVESPDERETAGKPRAGRIALCAKSVDDALVISVEDDGRGIDWSKVEEKASALGLRHASHRDLVAALFTDGISTRDEVTDVSGRGVGLSALRASVEMLGGRIEVESALGRGTVLRCIFPRTPAESGTARGDWHADAAA